MDKHYDRPEVFILELMGPIKSHKLIKEGELRALAVFYNLVRTSIAQAVEVGMLEYTCSLTEISSVLSKLPLTERTFWGEKRGTVRPGLEG